MEEGHPWACGPHGCLHRSTHLLTPLRSSVSAPTLAPMDVVEVQRLRKEYRLLGAEAPRGLSGVVGRVGSIVDTPALYPRFSARPLDFPSLQRSTLGAGLYLAAAAALVLLCSAMVFRARDVT